MIDNTRSTTKNITEVSKNEPCLHCGKPDWCYRIGGLDVCKRKIAPADGWEKTSKSDREGDFYYALQQPKKAPRTPGKKEFIYYGRQGQKLVKVVRIDKEGGGKDFKQHHYNTDKQRWLVTVPEDIKAQVPLYRYGQVQKAIERGREIFLVEGEGCADVLFNLGFPATTVLGGLGKYKSEKYKQDLAGAKVVLCPDRDRVCMKAMEKIALDFPDAQWLYAPPSDYFWHHLAENGGLDIFDWIESGATRDEIKAAIGEKIYSSEPPKLESDRPEAEALNFSLPEAEEIFTQKATAALFGDTKWISLNEHLHRWNGTHYELVADAAIRAKIAHWCASTPVQHKDRRQYDYAKSSYVENIWNWVHLAFAVDPSLINPPGINCLNGTVRLHWLGKKVTWKLEPHSPDELYIYTNKINYDPKADRTQCDRLLACLEPDQQDILLKTLAASLDLATVRKYRSRIKSIFNQGDGNNGKDSIREAASYLYGSSMTSATISDFQVYDSGKKFPLAKLENSLINWSSENASLKSIDGLQSLKAAITGEPLDVERKNQDERPMLLNTVFFFNINEAPNLQAGLEAIQSRWAVLSFNKTFKVGADISKGELEADSRFRYDPEFLQTEVVPALLNRVLDALPRLMDEGIDYSCTQKALESIQQKTNHLWAFASEVGLSYSAGGRVYINELWERLRDWYIANGTLEIHKTSEGKVKEEWHDPVSRYDKNVRGANQIYQRFSVLFPKITKDIESGRHETHPKQTYLSGICIGEGSGEPTGEGSGEGSGEGNNPYTARVGTLGSQFATHPSEMLKNMGIDAFLEGFDQKQLEEIFVGVMKLASQGSHPCGVGVVAFPTAFPTAFPLPSQGGDKVPNYTLTNSVNQSNAHESETKSGDNINKIGSDNNQSIFLPPAPSSFKVGDKCRIIRQCYGIPQNKELTILKIEGAIATVMYKGCKSSNGVEIELNWLEKLDQEAK